MPSVTLRDVAKLAGVSLGTASHALNNRASVLPETRAKVLEAAISLGYKPKEGNGKTHSLAVIGMLTKHDFGLPVDINPFFTHVQLGVESECRARDISLMYANIEVDASNHPLVWPRMVTDGHVDGLIVVGANIDELMDGLRRKLNKPMVLVDSYAPAYGFDSVLIDNIKGTREAALHLLAQGHRHFALLGSNPQSPPDILERRDSFLQTVRNHGSARVHVEDSRLAREDCYAAALRLMKQKPEISAYFACNDDSAIGVINAAQDLGLDVPRDVSVVGFDDIDLAWEIKPALTTVLVPKLWLGKLGVQRLVERAQNPDQPQLTLTVSTHLVERETVSLAGAYKEVAHH
jgi:LacI family transcriptional regulator